jgi:SAM-dependent methyltransferase
MGSRRDQVPFDARYYEKRASADAAPPAAAVFRDIYRRHHWSGSASPSGAGAAPDQTAELRRSLPPLLGELGIRTMLDLPCGDYSWMRQVDLPLQRYIGADLLPELIEALAANFGDAGHEFRVVDLTRDPLPAADLVLCRDCLVHLSYDDIRRALRNLVTSRIPWLLTTTFPGGGPNEDIVTGDWRVLDLQAAPFHLPPPARILNEGCTEAGGAFADKSLGLWSTDQLRDLEFLNR